MLPLNQLRNRPGFGFTYTLYRLVTSVNFVSQSKTSPKTFKEGCIPLLDINNYIWISKFHLMLAVWKSTSANIKDFESKHKLHSFFLGVLSFLNIASGEGCGCKNYFVASSDTNLRQEIFSWPVLVLV